MTTLKRLLFAGAIVATSMTQAVSMKGFDATLLNPYILEARVNLEQVAEQFKYDDHGFVKTMWTSVKFAEALYPRQKAALKIPLKKLKHNALALKKGDKALWLPARQLYKAFKHNVYRGWKKDFKNQFKKAKQLSMVTADRDVDVVLFCCYGPSLPLVLKNLA